MFTLKEYNIQLAYQWHYKLKTLTQEMIILLHTQYIQVYWSSITSTTRTAVAIIAFVLGSTIAIVIIVTKVLIRTWVMI